MWQLTDSQEVLEAIKEVWNSGGRPVTVRYQMKGRNGSLDVVSSSSFFLFLFSSLFRWMIDDSCDFFF